MNQSICSGCRSELRWQAQSKFRIQNHLIRQQGRMKDHLLATILDNDGTTPHFTARSRRRRNGDAWSKPAPIRTEFKRQYWLLRSLDANANDLPHIKRTPATKGDHRITLILLVSFGGRFHILNRRIWMYARKHRPPSI